MKKIFLTLITLFVYCNLFAYTQMHIYSEEKHSWTEDREPGEEIFWADNIDSIKYVKETIEIDDDTTDKKYAITYIYDNDGIRVDSLKYGEMPGYYGGYKYFPNHRRSFNIKSWSPAITRVKSDAVYTAVYDTIHRPCCFVFLDHKDSIISSGFVDTYSDIKQPEYVPVIEKNLIYEYNYTWDYKWEEDYNYLWKGVLDSTYIQYVIILRDEEGNQLSCQKKNYLYVPPSKIYVPYLKGWKVVSSWTLDNSLIAHDTIIYTAKFNDEEVTNDGLLPSSFPINDSTFVYFSKGNLQYNAGDGNTHKTADSTAQGTWRFAERQYDYVGEENVGKDSTYNGWVDLFEWGSSGWKGTHDHKGYVALDTAQCRNADWGVYNAISNGGNEPGLWRSLTHNEWAYLLNRSDWAYAKIGEASTLCLVIFPSDFVTPDTMNIVYASTSDKHDFKYEDAEDHWIGYGPGIRDSNTNTFSDEEFEELEARGVVALPFAGHIESYRMLELNEYGNIWTSTHNGSYSCEIYFGEGDFACGGCDAEVKKSVRLVHVVE